MDYRRLNAQIDLGCLSPTKNILDRIGQVHYITTLDLVSFPDCSLAKVEHKT